MTDATDPAPTTTGKVSVRWATATDVGLVRTINEDSLLASPPLFMVADGMGGHDAGEVASAIAVEEFDRLVGADPLTIEDLGGALHTAADRIDALSDGGPLSAGTTVALVATMEIDDVAYWVVLNLGDSRVYRATEGLFEQVSVDHSVVQELMDRGELTEAEARVHPYRHMITRALGAGPESDPDYWLIPAEPGDRMLICSDGLTGEVSDPVLERVLRDGGSPEDVCATLVELALSAGGHDNVTVVVVDALEVDGAPADPAPAGSDAAEHFGDDDTWPRSPVTPDDDRA